MMDLFVTIEKMIRKKHLLGSDCCPKLIVYLCFPNFPNEQTLYDLSFIVHYLVIRTEFTKDQ